MATDMEDIEEDRAMDGFPEKGILSAVPMEDVTHQESQILHQYASATGG